MVSEKFKFYTQATIEKAVDKEGKTVMKMGGIASTADEDADGEFLDPNGFVVDDFMSTGLVNWHHGVKNKPKMIVGEPTIAEIRPEGFYVECLLYPSSEIAREIYETAEILEKDSNTRRLGFSIEGEVIERQSDDEDDALYKKIKKANITGLAITHMPKNGKTFAQIIKGFVEAEGTEGESSEGDDSEAEGSGLNTKSGKSIIKESLDKHPKKLVPTSLSIKKSKFEIINLDEDSAYDKIFDTFSDINIEKAKKVFTLLTIIDQGMKNGTINEDKLEKAFGALGLEVSEQNPFLQKAKADDDSDEDDEEEEVDEDSKKVADKIQAENYSDKKKVEKGNSDELEEADDKTEKLEKAKAIAGLGESKGLYLTLSKEILKAKAQNSIENRALGVLVKAVLDENQLLKSQVDNQLEIFNNQSQMIEEQSEIIKGFMEKFENFGSAPAPRKSIVKGFAERFEEKPEQIEKANSNVLSVSRNKAAILDVLDKKTFAKGFNEAMSKATISFEASGEISPETVRILKEENGITIVQ